MRCLKLKLTKQAGRVAAGLLVVLATGCSSGNIRPSATSRTTISGSIATSPSVAAPAAARLTSAAVALLLGSKTLSEQSMTLAQAEDRLTEQCMTEQGFPTDPAKIASSPIPFPESPDMTRAREHGYGITDPQTPSTGVMANRSKTDQLAYQKALFGATGHQTTVHPVSGGEFSYTDSGCVASARSRLYGNLATYGELLFEPQVLDMQLRTKAENSSAYGHALVSWRSCMKGSGIPAADPLAAAGSVAALVGKTSVVNVRTREIAVAVADAHCDAQAHLTATRRTAAIAELANIPGVVAADLNHLAVRRSEDLDAAQKLIDN